MQRKVIAELLDDDLGTPAEIAESLRDLRHVNNWFGGTRTTTSLLRRIAAQDRRQRSCRCWKSARAWAMFRCGASSALASDGITLRVTLLDRRWTHLPAQWRRRRSAGDAMRLPFRDDAFDVVSCSLFAHHFDPEHACRSLATKPCALSRRAVLINDLIRSRLHLRSGLSGSARCFAAASPGTTRPPRCRRPIHSR